MPNDNDKLKKIYSSIIRGYSIFYLNNNPCYIKHLSFLDSSDIDSYKQRFFDRAKDEGLPTYSERFNKVVEEKTWTLEKDRKIQEYKDFISNLHHSKTLLPLERDRKLVDKNITEYTILLNQLVIEKEGLIGLTCEKWADRKINEYYVFLTLFKDPELSEKFYNKEEFNDLEQFELDKITRIYNDKMGDFSANNLKRISLVPFFFNIFCLCSDSIKDLFGKPLAYLTFYQIEIIQNAKTFKNILENSKTPPPAEYLKDSDKLLDWFEKSSSTNKLMKNEEVEESPDKKVITAVQSPVGMNKEELENVGYDNSAQKKIDKALKESKSGELTMDQMLKMEI